MRDARHALALVHYDDSPVGGYDEFAVYRTFILRAERDGNFRHV